MEKREPSYAAGSNVSRYMENSIEVPLKIGISPSLYDLLHSV